MTHIEFNPEAGTADFKLEEGCLLCGGELAVRLTPLGATSVCVHCRWMSNPRVAVSRGQLSLEPVVHGTA